MVTALAPVPDTELFFSNDKPEVMKELDAFLSRDPAGIVASYVIGKENSFGTAEWKKYFNVEIQNPPKLPPAFYAWWFSSDPMEPTKLRSETHFPPVLRPSYMCLSRLDALVRGLKVSSSNLRFTSDEARSVASIPEDGACWLVLRKDLFKR